MQDLMLSVEKSKSFYFRVSSENVRGEEKLDENLSSPFRFRCKICIVLTFLSVGYRYDRPYYRINANTTVPKL